MSSVLIPWYIRYAPQMVVACVFISAVLLIYGCGRIDQRQANATSDLKAAVKAQDKAAKQVERSADISKATAEKVGKQGEQTRQRTERAVEVVREVISAGVVSSDVPDPAVLREADQAYQRAIAAHCRVQREKSCPDATSAAEVN